MSAALTHSIDLRCWSLDAIQHTGSRKLIEKVLDARIASDVRQRAARKLLRDGSRHTWLILFEYMHDTITRGDEERSTHLLAELAGALRVKALKVLWDESKNEGEDHLSAMRWLQHCVREDDAPLLRFLLEQWCDEPTLYEAMCRTVTHCLRSFCSSSIPAASLLLHTMLFEVPCTHINLIKDALAGCGTDAHAWITEPLLHAFHTSQDIEVRTVCIELLYTREPERFQGAVEAHIDELFATRREELDGPIQRHLALVRTAQQRASQCLASLPTLLDHLCDTGEFNKDEALPLISAASRHIPTILVHAALPYLLRYTEERRDVLLTQLATCRGIAHSIPLLVHHFYATASHRTRVHILSTCALALVAQPGEAYSSHHSQVQDMLHETMHVSIHTWRDDEHTMLRAICLLDTHFHVLTLAMLTSPDTSPDARAFLAEVARAQPMCAHIASTSLAERARLTHALQAMHDDTDDERLIAALRKLLNVVRRLI